MTEKTYLVGGAVRDELLGLPVRERDWVVVGSTPDAMLKQGFQPVGKDFPVFIHPTSGEEYALARTERKTGAGYTGFQCYSAPDVTLEDDLKRRDFTINAIAKDAAGHLIDPFHGQRDLQNGILRHVSAAFIEDPLRVLRGARFLARFPQLIVAEDTLQLIKNMIAQDELNHLVPERIWKETARSLASDHPARFFHALHDWGGLAVLFPEIDQLFGVPQDPVMHPEIDVGVHTMMVLEQAARFTADPITRFAALMHDLGKGITEKTEWPKHPDHEEKGVTLLKTMCRRLKIPNDYRELAEITTRFHGHCHRALELSPNEIVDLFEKTDAFRRPERFEKYLLACEVDSRGRTGFENEAYPQRAFLQSALQRCQSIDTQSLIARGLKGAALGNAIRDLRIAAIHP